MVDLTKHDNGTSTYYGGCPSNPAALITDTFTVNEWRLIKDALEELSANAVGTERHNEKTLNHGCRSNGISPEHYCDDCKLADHERAAAALRALATKNLAEKIKV
jgi:hypothetical protein